MMKAAEVLKVLSQLGENFRLFRWWPVGEDVGGG